MASFELATSITYRYAKLRIETYRFSNYYFQGAVFSKNIHPPGLI
ncbi:hypothetical protein PLANPX_4210 [Lacipirellula parvula]|uniref:Uncharacterized protein n=1 Tax=Lacipirellula parvula TaxID=2650471 RepID=A0A5K7XDP2_9BACT|nr:hypothetical protein PLANPX_4210 [Lacipirellula parvula]